MHVNKNPTQNWLIDRYNYLSVVKYIPNSLNQRRTVINHYYCNLFIIQHFLTYSCQKKRFLLIYQFLMQSLIIFLANVQNLNVVKPYKGNVNPITLEIVRSVNFLWFFLSMIYLISCLRERLCCVIFIRKINGWTYFV